MSPPGLNLRAETILQTLTLDVTESSEIEGVILDNEQVRSSIAKRLGIDIAGTIPPERHIDGVVEMMLDGFFGNLTVSKWAKITKASKDTTLRDIQDKLSFVGKTD